MFFESYPKGFSLRYNVHVMIIYSQAVLDFARELADDDLHHLSDEDQHIYIDLADQLEALSVEAGKLRARVRYSQQKSGA